MTFESVFETIIRYSILILEAIGVVIVLKTAVTSFVNYLLKRGQPSVELAEGISLALNFEMGGEVLRTLIVREKEELIILAAIILCRAALTALLRWESGGFQRNRKANDAERAPVSKQTAGKIPSSQENS